MRGDLTLRVSLTALFAALISLATMLIRVPSPLGGYINLGDGIILVAAMLLNPVSAMIAAAIGSATADLLSGYPMYAIGTLIIKGLAAFVAATVVRHKARGRIYPNRAILLAGVCGEAVVVAGYFLYGALALGYGLAAVASIPGDLCQGVLGVIVMILLTPALLGSRDIQRVLGRIKS